VDAHAASRVGGPAQRGTLLVGVLLLVALAAWIVTIDRMTGMDAGPGTALGGLGWFTGVWVTMMAAMMLPSTAPAVLLFSRTAARSARPAPATAAFVGGYLAGRVLDPLKPEQINHMAIAVVCLVLSVLAVIASVLHYFLYLLPRS